VSSYFNINATTCAAYPSQVNITNIRFENFRVSLDLVPHSHLFSYRTALLTSSQGYSSGKYGDAVARLTCSPAAVCENITFTNFNITSPCGGKPVVICDGIKGDIGIPCVNSTSPEATAALKNKCSTAMATLPKPTPWS
jgi:galacturan 1,4-alpha-galacturonidase